jgi:SAM-dependent methyltransferase
MSADADPTGWFEPLYRAAERGERVVPWDSGAPQPLLVRWAVSREPGAAGRRAIVVGSAFGDDAQFLAGLGWETVAFDVAPTAIAAARRRFAHSAVEHVVADLLDLPPDWEQAFALVVESRTVQSLPDPTRREAIAQVARLVAPGGTLLVLAAARDAADGPVDGPPWPLTRAEIDAFAGAGLVPVRIEDLDEGDRGRWWRAEFTRPMGRSSAAVAEPAEHAMPGLLGGGGVEARPGVVEERVVGLCERQDPVLEAGGL